MMMRYIDGVTQNYNTFADLTEAQIRDIDFDYNNVIKHGKGWSIISALECLLGKDVFDRVHKRCLEEYAHRYIHYRDFWKICEDESGEELGWFFEQWVRSNKYMSYSITNQASQKKNDRFISTIEVTCHGTLKMPVPVKATFEDGSSHTKFSNQLFEKQALVFESKSELKEAVLNPENELANINDPNFASQGEILEKISQLPWTDAKDRAMELAESAKQMQINDLDVWFKLGMVLAHGLQYSESLFSFLQAHNIDRQSFIILAWLGHMHDQLGNREEALRFYEQAIENDDGGPYQHSQFGLYVNKKWVEERLETPFKLE